MPTTYTPLATTTLGSNAGTVTLSGISGSYTDLVLVMSIIGNAAQEIYFRVNGDTNTNYSGTRLSGNGTTATSARASNQSVGFISSIATTSTTNPNFNSITYFQNYSNTTTFKTVLSRANNASVGTEAFVSLWRSTAAITSIEISSSTSSFAAGSTFSLYGVASAAVVSGAKATGGDIIATDGTYWYHAFLASGTFTPTQTLSCDYLVVAGGAGGGYDAGGGGGAGGLRSQTSQSLSATGYTVTVGAGGAGSGVFANAGTNGSNSVFNALTSTGGGGGSGINGQNGGSGGGGGRNSGATGGISSPVTSPVQGFAGGNGNNAGGGGGGAGAVGSNAPGGNAGGAGGVGSSSFSSYGLATGTGQNSSGTVYFAGGGGGGGNFAAGGAGGLGGGAAGGNNTAGANGTANTGGGGAGAGGGMPSGTGGAGGSGLVIVRYAV